MSVEIERKFLVLKLPEKIVQSQANPILQGYISIEKGGNEVRIRKKNKQCYLTVKSTGSLERAEEELKISETVFNRLLPLCNDRIVEKTRYEYNEGGHTIEIDIFSGKLQGLTLAEVEFKTKVDSLSFKKPTWFGREVTALQGYKNRNLAVFGLPDN